jgi:hypothetical protein
MAAGGHHSICRTTLFLLGCIGTRLGLAALAWYLGSCCPLGLRVMGVLALGPALGFALIYAFGWRRTGGEVFGEAIWWDRLRPVHALMYLAFACLAIAGVARHAWKVLLLDAVLGLAAYVVKRTSTRVQKN